MSIETPEPPAAPADDAVARHLLDGIEDGVAGLQRVYRRHLGEPACPSDQDVMNALRACPVGLRIDGPRLTLVVIDGRRDCDGFEQVHLDDSGTVCNHTATVGRGTVLDHLDHADGDWALLERDRALAHIRDGDSRRWSR